MRRKNKTESDALAPLHHQLLREGGQPKPELPAILVSKFLPGPHCGAESSVSELGKQEGRAGPRPGVASAVSRTIQALALQRPGRPHPGSLQAGWPKRKQDHPSKSFIPQGPETASWGCLPHVKRIPGSFLGLIS